MGPYEPSAPLSPSDSRPLSRRLRYAVKDWSNHPAVYNCIVVWLAQAEDLEKITKRLLERLRDEWAMDEGAYMDANDIELERIAAALLGEGPP